jgi:hypothetical protein
VAFWKSVGLHNDGPARLAMVSVVVTVTRSPRRIGVKLRHRFDPFQRIAFALSIEAGDLLCNPLSDGTRSGVRDDQAQLT